MCHFFDAVSLRIKCQRVLRRSTSINSYGFTVDQADLSRDAVQSFIIMSVVGSKTAILEMLVSTLEHEILHGG